MRWWPWLVVLLLALLATLVAIAPARVLTDRLAAGDEGVLSFGDVRGTVWNGAAGHVQFRGEPLGRVQWTLSPWAVLRGRIDARWLIEGPVGTGTGRLRREGEQLRIDAVDAELPAELLAPVLAAERLVPHGRLLLHLDDLQFRGRLPASAAGQLRWSPARVGGIAHADLGDLVADFGMRGEGVLAGTLSDSGGPLGLEGHFEVSWLGYGVEAMLTPRTGAAADAIAGIGQPRADHSRLIAVEGRWLAPPGRRPD